MQFISVTAGNAKVAALCRRFDCRLGLNSPEVPSAHSRTAGTQGRIRSSRSRGSSARRKARVSASGVISPWAIMSRTEVIAIYVLPCRFHLVRPPGITARLTAIQQIVRRKRKRPVNASDMLLPPLGRQAQDGNSAAITNYFKKLKFQSCDGN